MSNEYGDVVWLEIDRIDHRPASEVRAGTNEESVGRYAESFDDLPPLLVTVDADGRHWLDDGYHRYCAADRLGKETVACRTRVGTYLDAFSAACHANDKHGLQATNADKRRRVERALNDPEMRNWSNARIAELCGVSDMTVGRIRPQPTSTMLESGEPPRTIGRDGRSRPARRPRAEPVGPDPVAEEGPAPARNGFHREEVVIEFEPSPVHGRRLPTPPSTVEHPEECYPADGGEDDGGARIVAPGSSFADLSGLIDPVEEAIRDSIGRCPEESRPDLARELRAVLFSSFAEVGVRISSLHEVRL